MSNVGLVYVMIRLAADSLGGCEATTFLPKPITYIKLLGHCVKYTVDNLNCTLTCKYAKE